jgi:hypothetical protein
MLHPDQFEVNQSWIAFKLNDEPVHTEEDGDFDVIALMDAASGFILSSVPVSAMRAEPTELESRRLLKDGHAHKKQWPRTLFVPTNQPARFLSHQAELEGITVIRVAEDHLLLFIDEARDGFREHFGSGGAP